MWRPNSLREAISEAVNFPLDKSGRYQCPNCKAFRVSDCIVDVRNLPIPEDWACDVCWTKWERTARVVDGGLPINGRFDWRRRWVIAHSAPAEIAQKFERLQAL